jgi:hypothetical protein
LRPAAAFCAFVPPRDDVERELLEAERDLEVPDVERERDVPDDERDLVVPDLLVPDVARERLVPDVERELVEREDVDRDFAAVARPPLAPAAFFCAVLLPRLDVDRDFAAVARPPLAPAAFFCAVPPPRLELDRDFAAVARPPLAPAAFFCAVLPPRLELDRDDPVERLRPVVEREVLRDVPELRDVPDFFAPDFAREPELLLEVDRDREPLDDDRRGDAARAREIVSSRSGSSATDSTPNRSGM